MDKSLLLAKFLEELKANNECKFNGSIEEGDIWMKEHPENVPHIRILDDGIQIIY